MGTEAKTTDVHERLARLAKKGRLTPAIVVADAKKPDSPLHDLFEWDDTKAGHAWRIQQARYLIQSVRVEITQGSRVIMAPCYVRDPSVPHADQGYVSLATLRNDKAEARAALQQHMAGIAGRVESAAAFASALGLEREFDNLLASIATLRERLEALDAAA